MIHPIVWMGLKKHYAKLKLDTKSYMLYDSICMKCSEEANPQRQKADEYVLGAGEGGRRVTAQWVWGFCLGCDGKLWS